MPSTDDGVPDDPDTRRATVARGTVHPHIIGYRYERVQP